LQPSPTREAGVTMGRQLAILESVELIYFSRVEKRSRRDVHGIGHGIEESETPAGKDDRQLGRGVWSLAPGQVGDQVVHPIGERAPAFGFFRGDAQQGDGGEASVIVSVSHRDTLEPSVAIL
jgi:hypothetical protein